MDQRKDALIERINAFSDEVIALVSDISGEDWTRTCEWEEWTVGTTARHMGNHLGIYELAEMMVQGQALPQWSMDDINAMSNKDSEAHADCTKDQALELLRERSAGMTAFLSGLSEGDLDRKGSMPAFNGEVTVEQLIEYVVFQSAAQHLDSIKAALAG